LNCKTIAETYPVRRDGFFVCISFKAFGRDTFCIIFEQKYHFLQKTWLFFATAVTNPLVWRGFKGIDFAKTVVNNNVCVVRIK
jgi:hypothetical protein